MSSDFVRAVSSIAAGAGVSALAVVAGLVLSIGGASDARAQVVIRQVYGGNGSVYRQDFVELFNRGGASVSLDGWSLQYASATGTGLFSHAAPSDLAGSLAPGQSLLVGLASSASGAPLPVPLLIGNAATNLASASGKVALVRSAIGLACNGGSTPCGPVQRAQIVDLVGYGAANYSEGAAAPAASGTSALFRTGGGCDDTFSNAADFAPAPPLPRTAASPPSPCPPAIAVELRLDAGFASELDESVVTATAIADAPVAGPQSVALTVGGAGVTPSDYAFETPEPPRIVIPDGGVSGSVRFRVEDDAEVESSERASLALANTSSGIRLGGAIDGEIAIADDDGCALPATGIHAVQGPGIATPLAGGVVTVEGIATAVFLGADAPGTGAPGADPLAGDAGALQGFFLQEEGLDADADPGTAEGLFVFEGGSGLATGIAARDRVRVTGRAAERQGATALEGVSSVALCAHGEALPAAVDRILPVPGVPSDDLEAARAVIDADHEAFEGMRVRFREPLVVADLFDLTRAGQLVLDQGGRIQTYTDASLPSAAGFLAHQIEIARRRIVVDDGDDRSDAALALGRPLPYPIPGLSLGHHVRTGDRITGLTGILDGATSSAAAAGAWRIRPVEDAPIDAFESANPRPAAPPEVGGSLEIMSFNVMNFFATIDATASNSNGACGPSRSLDCRGADSLSERARQMAKLVAALCRVDAGVVALMETENDAGAATAALAAAANAIPGCGPYAVVGTGPIGGDAIRVALLYAPARVEPIGSPAILTGAVDPRFVDGRNRPVLAQTLEERATGRRFTIAVAHLKSKGSSCADLGDPDTGDGQGDCNATRTTAARALVDWLAGDPTASGDRDFLIVGDLNSYAREDPVRAIEAGPDDVAGTADDYVDLVRRFSGPAAYSYVFDGQTGRLDHALASGAFFAQVSGATPWPIDADEPPAFDYDDAIRDPGEAAFEAKPGALPLYAGDEFRAADHDPLVIGLPEPGGLASFGVCAGALIAAARTRASRGAARRRSAQGASRGRLRRSAANLSPRSPGTPPSRSPSRSRSAAPPSTCAGSSGSRRALPWDRPSTRSPRRRPSRGVRACPGRRSAAGPRSP